MELNKYIDSVNTGFELKEKDGVRFLVIPSFENTGIVNHGFSTRIGGVSKNEFESLNFSLKREGNKENFVENFKRLCSAANVEYSELCLVNYAHGDGIYSVCKNDKGKGLWRENDIPKCDALIVDKKGCAAATMHADCVPVFVLDKEKNIAAVSHAGWRGVVSKLPGKIINKFISDYSSKTENILVGIGPHIMKCCFEVGEEVAREFDGIFLNTVLKKENRFYVDMQSAILQQMKEAGISPKNITCANLCTYCNKELFYSHRREKGKTGAMASVISLKK